MDFFEKEPGVYVTDEQQDAPVASGSSVGTLLFLGVTESGPVEGDVEVTDFNTWTRIFGDFVSDTHDLYKQVKKAFLNGAKKVRTKRVVHPDGDLWCGPLVCRSFRDQRPIGQDGYHCIAQQRW